MLHLEARIHFRNNPHLVIEQEFHGAGPNVIAAFGHFNGAVAHGLAQFGCQDRRRRFFDHFLVTALDAALAFKQVHNVAVHVGEDLNFDVPGRSDEAFDEYGPVAEGIHRFGYRPFEAVFQLGIFTNDAHAFTTATSTGQMSKG